jgi:hypothetical protein
MKANTRQKLLIIPGLVGFPFLMLNLLAGIAHWPQTLEPDSIVRRWFYFTITEFGLMGHVLLYLAPMMALCMAPIYLVSGIFPKRSSTAAKHEEND